MAVTSVTTRIEVLANHTLGAVNDQQHSAASQVVTSIFPFS